MHEHLAQRLNNGYRAPRRTSTAFLAWLFRLLFGGAVVMGYFAFGTGISRLPPHGQADYSWSRLVFIVLNFAAIAVVSYFGARVAVRLRQRVPTLARGTWPGRDLGT
ncbi:hypothetical protein FHW23_000195 [Curtobacterium pusillum]|uniref:Uncharacterized protein n=1 Tax=Curtobacterium pusillum TaxID=69373 RepID=A0AAW3T0X4_9MICO|nr:hypothetical protein [Curtobacterium pusillum]MBA8988963.1 hypothetical protein [Curtobacterium pusillum]